MAKSLCYCRCSSTLKRITNAWGSSSRDPVSFWTPHILLSGYMCLCLHTYMYMYICTHVYMYIYMHIYVYTCVYTCTRTCLNAQMLAHTSCKLKKNSHYQNQTTSCMNFIKGSTVISGDQNMRRQVFRVRADCVQIPQCHIGITAKGHENLTPKIEKLMVHVILCLRETFMPFFPLSFLRY